MMKPCTKTLLALLLALALLAGTALAEEELALGQAVEGPVNLDVLAPEDGALAVDGAALVSEEPAAAQANATDGVVINSKNFPDKAFRAYVKKTYGAIKLKPWK